MMGVDPKLKLLRALFAKPRGFNHYRNCHVANLSKRVDGTNQKKKI